LRGWFSAKVLADWLSKKNLGMGGDDLAKEKRPAYFRFFLEACDMISLLEVESAGRVIHAVSDYFSEGAEPENLNKNERTVFNRIRRDIDKNFSDYEASVTYGKKGRRKTTRSREAIGTL